MDDIQIRLPCGFSTLYKFLKSNISNEIECMECHSHKLDIKQCLEMPFNRLNLKQKELELKNEEFKKSKLVFEKYKQDPTRFVNDCIHKLNSDIESDRERIKKEINRRVDAYYNSLRIKIIKQINSNRLNLDSNLDLNDLDLEIKETEFEQKMESIEKNLKALTIRNDLIKSSLGLDGYEFKTPNIEVLLPCDIAKPSGYSFETIDSIETKNTDILSLEIFSDTQALTGSLNQISLWDTKTKSCTKTFNDNGFIMCLCTLSDELFASGSNRASLKIWNARTGDCVRSLDGHTNYVNDLKLNNLGFLLSASSDLTIRKWNYKTGECLKIGSGHTNLVYELSVKEDKILSCSADGTVKMWSQDLECLKTFKDDQHDVLLIPSHVLILDDEHFATTVGFAVLVWSLKSGKVLNIRNARFPLNSLKQLERDVIICSNYEGEMIVYNYDDLDSIHSVLINTKPEQKNMNNFIVDVRKSGLVFTSDPKGVIKIWKYK